MNTDRRRPRGFTLLEALMALLVLFLAMLLGYGLAARQPMAMERLEAGEDAMRAIESALETLRAQTARPRSRNLQPVLDYSPPVKARDLLLDLEVETANPAGPPDLYLVRVVARYRVGRALHSRQVETLIWKPQ